MTRLLEPGEPDPVDLVNAGGNSPVVLVCEHAGRRIPARLGTLGLSEAETTGHIAWDIGADAVTRDLSARLDAPAVIQRYSRLAYDCNRPPEAPGAMPVLSEVTEIPGNRDLEPASRMMRTAEIYRPFHAALSALLDERAARGQASLLVTIHSFTRVYKGHDRQVQLGILHDWDARLADALLATPADFDGFAVERNQPYGPEDGVTHTLIVHGLARGLVNVMIEIRNDLIADEAGQSDWARRLASALRRAMKTG